MKVKENYGKRWSEDETILAFYYYCKIPFGKISKNNQTIIYLAGLIGRTPSSVGLKMCNLAHFDPSLRDRNVVGMCNTSKQDEEIVKRFLDNWEELAPLAEQIESDYRQSALGIEMQDSVLPIGEDNIAEVKQRINQEFFRNAVLSSYSQQCCITGLAVPSLLVASHIKPWAVSNPKTERTNPSNGLWLNALHDKAFDRGLITVLPDYTIRVSKLLKASTKTKENNWLIACDKQEIALPVKFLPDKKFLEYHNDVIFEKTVV